MSNKISTGTFLAGLWLAFLVIGSLAMYPLFLESMAEYAEEARRQHGGGTELLSWVSPKVMYYAGVAQVLGIGFAVIHALSKTQNNDANGSS